MHTHRSEDKELMSVWKKFEHLIPNEAEAVEEVYKILFDDRNAVCFHCGFKKNIRAYGYRYFKCSLCKKRTWFTSGTFFHRMKSLRPILAALWMLENRVSINAFKFHKLLGLGYSAALQTFRKVACLVSSGLNGSLELVPSTEFATIVSRRSKETRAKEHPITEIEDSKQAFYAEYSETDDTQKQKALSRPDSEAKIYEILTESPLNEDEICAITSLPPGGVSASLVMLQMDGLIDSLPGNRYVKYDDAPESDPLKIHRNSSTKAQSGQNAQAALAFIQERHRGISRRYLQFYACMQWFHDDIINWFPGSLIEACKTGSNTAWGKIRSYISPYLIQIHVPEG